MDSFTVIGIRSVDGGVDVLTARPGRRGLPLDAGPAWLLHVDAETSEDAANVAVEIARGDWNRGDLL